MKQQESSAPTNQQASEQANKDKSTAYMNAALIGFLIGIVIYSVAQNSVGFFTLIPLYFVYKLVNKPKAESGMEEDADDTN